MTQHGGDVEPIFSLDFSDLSIILRCLPCLFLYQFEDECWFIGLQILYVCSLLGGRWEDCARSVERSGSLPAYNVCPFAVAFDLFAVGFSVHFG